MAPHQKWTQYCRFTSWEEGGVERHYHKTRIRKTYGNDRNLSDESPETGSQRYQRPSRLTIRRIRPNSMTFFRLDPAIRLPSFPGIKRKLGNHPWLTAAKKLREVTDARASSTYVYLTPVSLGNGWFWKTHQQSVLSRRL